MNVRGANDSSVFGAKRGYMAAPSEVFASLQAVRVPAQVPPGAQFDVYIRKTQRGVQVASKTPLWRASGSVPVQHGRVVVSTTGKRHQQRPSAAPQGAAGAAGRARLVSVADFYFLFVAQGS